MRTTRPRTVAAIAVAASLTLTACGASAPDQAEQDDQTEQTEQTDATDPPDADAETEQAQQEAPTTEGQLAAEDGVGDPIVVGLEDYAFVDLPTTVPAGTALTVDNRSVDELHELVAVLLPEDEDRSAEELMQLPPAELAGFFGGVRAVLLQAPGSDQVIPAVGDGTLTDPGRYLVLCAIPTGADPQEYLTAAAESEEGPPEVAGGPPHLASGMWGEVTVEG